METETTAVRLTLLEVMEECLLPTRNVGMRTRLCSCLLVAETRRESSSETTETTERHLSGTRPTELIAVAEVAAVGMMGNPVVSFEEYLAEKL